MSLQKNEIIPTKKQKTNKDSVMSATSWKTWTEGNSIRVQVLKVNIGGAQGDKKPSWALLAPISDSEIRRFLCWTAEQFNKIGLVEGNVIDIVGLRNCPAYNGINNFISNYASPYELTGTNVHITCARSPTTSTAPLLTTPLLHQLAGCGRISGIVQLIDEPSTETVKSLRCNDENTNVIKTNFTVKLDDNALVAVTLWGDIAEHFQGKSNQAFLVKLAFVSNKENSISLSTRTPTQRNPSPQQPSISKVTPAELQKHRETHANTGFDATTMKTTQLTFLSTKSNQLLSELKNILQQYHSLATQ